MNKKYFPVDKAPPVVDSLKFESRLNRGNRNFIQIFFEFIALLWQALQEEISRIKSQHTVFGESVRHVFAIPAAVALGEPNSFREQVVGIERWIEIRIQFIEAGQMFLCVSLPFRITEQVHVEMRMWT